MKQLFINEVNYRINYFLDDNQRIKLKEILTEICLNYHIEIIEQSKNQEIQITNTDILNKFISSKEIEGCSTRTLNYYKDNISKMLATINLPIDAITTKILRNYLANYKNNSNAGWIGHCFKDYETLVKGNIKGKLDLLFSANDGERDKMLTTNTELDKWIEQL